MPRFVFVDTEATGLDHARHELTEISWIVRFEDGTEATRQYFPEHTLDGADSTALELTNYHRAIAPHPRTPATVWLRQFLDDANGAYLVGAVPDFDATHLARMCRKLGWEPTWDHHLVDVETLALPLIAPGPEGPRSLARTARALGVNHDDDRAHGALYDARQAMRVFDAVWQRLGQLRADDAPLPDPVPRRRNGQPPQVELVEVTEDNWRAVADVAPTDAQRSFVFPLAGRYLLLAERSEWNSLGITCEGAVVGHVMWAFEPAPGDATGTGDEIAWIGGLVINASRQGRGLGTAAVRALLQRLGDREVRVTVHPDNHGARRLWQATGFTPTDEVDGTEQVWARPQRDTDPGTRPAGQSSGTEATDS